MLILSRTQTRRWTRSCKVRSVGVEGFSRNEKGGGMKIAQL